MNDEPRESVYGTTVTEWIAKIPGDLPYDAISLWHVSVAGEHRFHLTGARLANFIKEGVKALLDADAVPVKAGPGTPHDWIAVHKYGHDKEQILQTIMQEWASSAKDDNFLFSIWFAQSKVVLEEPAP